MSETSREIRVYRASRGCVGFEANSLTRHPAAARCGTRSAPQWHHRLNHPSICLTHKQMRYCRTDWTCFRTCRLLQTSTVKMYLYPDSRRHQRGMMMWNREQANGGLDICGRPPTTWCTPSYVTPSCCSKVHESRISSFSRASDGTLTGRQDRCRGYSHRHTASPSSGALGRSYMRTTGAYDTNHTTLYYFFFIPR